MTSVSTNLSAAPPFLPPSLPEAFALLAAFDEEAAAQPVEIEGLSAAVPAPPGGDMEALAEESAHHRVLILRRGAVIAVTTLVSIGGAFLFHFFFAGAFVLAVVFGKGALDRNAIGGGVSADEGGKGYVFVDELPSAQPAAGASVLHTDPPAAALATPELKPLPDVAPAIPEATAVAVAPPPVVLPADDLGTVKVTPPAKTTVPPAVTVTPPNTTAVASAGGTKTGAKGWAVVGDNDSLADEPEINLFPGHGGSGQGEGKGTGRGKGLDRGISAANAAAQLLDGRAFEVPLNYRYQPPKKSIKLAITVNADGTIGEIKVTQSCGVPALDAALVANAQNTFRFRPAVEKGKTVASTFQFEQSFSE